MNVTQIRQTKQNSTISFCSIAETEKWPIEEKTAQIGDPTSFSTMTMQRMAEDETSDLEHIGRELSQLCGCDAGKYSEEIRNQVIHSLLLNNSHI